MYYFNSELIRRFPSVLGVSKMELYALLDVRNETFDKWTKGDMTVESLVNVSNILRISISDFIVTTEHPEKFYRESDYVFPREVWEPVVWYPRKVASLFGRGGITGIKKKEAAKRIGVSSPQAFDYWAASSSALRVKVLIQMLNEFHLDAMLFFCDNNKPIKIPAWENNEKHLVDILDERLESFRELERKVIEKDRSIRNLTAQNERLSKELRQVRSMHSETVPSGLLAESSVLYKARRKKHGYVFHSELWDSLPSMFEMQKTEFCDAIGISRSCFSFSRNIKVEALVKACNMLRISILHFFPPANESVVVHDRPYYEMSPRVFSPIESRMENMKFLFGRYSVMDYEVEDLGKLCGVKRRGFTSLSKEGDRARVLTLADVCTQFNIYPGIFFKDDNRKRPPYVDTMNLQLLENSISVMKENMELREEIRRMKARLKDLSENCKG